MDKEYLLQKWLNNELSADENEAFKQLDDYSELTGIIENASYFKADQFSKMVDFETFSKRLERKDVPVKKMNWVKPFLRIASVFVIGLALSYFFLYNNDVEVQTLAGEKTSLELPDASTVVVNAMSEISYSKKEWDEKREVQLKGEAFFKVAKGAKFDVITPEGIVTVVGTQFNVKQRDRFFEVVCYEGIVKVTAHNSSEVLKAGDRYRFSQDTAALEQTNLQNPQWTNNISSFERVPFSEVIAELERQYNVKVEINDINGNQLFSGGFVHNDLKNALKSICEPLKLEFKIKSETSVILKKLK